MADQYSAAYDLQQQWAKARTQADAESRALAAIKKAVSQNTTPANTRSGTGQPGWLASGRANTPVTTTLSLGPGIDPILDTGKYGQQYSKFGTSLTVTKDNYQDLLKQAQSNIDAANAAAGAAEAAYNAAPNKDAYQAKVAQDAANEDSGGFIHDLVGGLKTVASIAVEPIKLSVATITKAVDVVAGTNLTSDVLGATQIPGLSHNVENIVTTAATAVGAVLGGAALAGATAAGPKDLLSALKAVPVALSGAPDMPNAKTPTYQSDMASWDTNLPATPAPAAPTQPAQTAPATKWGPWIFAGSLGFSVLALLL